MNKFKLISLPLLGLLLVGCSQKINEPKSQPQTTTSRKDARSVVDYTDAIAEHGLPIIKPSVLDGEQRLALEKETGAEIAHATTFTTTSNVKVYILMTPSDAEALGAREYFASQNWHVHSDPSQKLVLAAQPT